MVVISRRDTDDFAPLSVSWQACGTYSDVIFPGRATGTFREPNPGETLPDGAAESPREQKPGLLLPLRP